MSRCIGFTFFQIDANPLKDGDFHLHCIVICSLNALIVYSTTKQGQQGPHKLSFLKSLKIQNPPPIPGVFTPATIRNGLIIKF